MRSIQSNFIVFLTRSWHLSILLIIVNCFAVFVAAQDFKTVHSGIEYARVERNVSGSKVKINLIRLDLTKVRIDVVHAMDASIGTESTSSIATRYGAIAAINAGFFRLDRSIFAGEDVGVLMIDRELLSESNSRIALMIKNGKAKTDIDFAHLDTSETIEIQKQTFQITGIDRERKKNDLIRYTPSFHRTTLTDPNGLEIVIRKGKIVSVRDGIGSGAIPPDGFVISASGTFREKLLPVAKVGVKVVVRSVFTPTVQNGTEDIVAGVPQLIKNGKIDITWEKERSSRSFVETRHPRTAIAKLEDGKALLITVDGRSESSAGISLADLAAYLLELGAVDAMNLDGGGSTAMFLDGKIVNTPSDKEGERKIGDAIIVRLRNN